MAEQIEAEVRGLRHVLGLERWAVWHAHASFMVGGGDDVWFCDSGHLDAQGAIDRVAILVEAQGMDPNGIRIVHYTLPPLTIQAEETK